MSILMNMGLVKRSYPGSYEKGQWKKGEPVNEDFVGTAQPAPGKAMELLPAGKRNNETILVFAPITMAFTPADEEKKVSGDLIIWEGCNYEIIIAKPWKVGFIPHWELVASRVSE